MGIRELARSLGYVGEYVDLNFVLDLPVDEAKLGEVQRWACEKSQGYEVVTWAGVPPPEWREAHALLGVLYELDFPPEAREPSPWTADQLEARFRAEISSGRGLIATLIVDVAGAPAAVSRLFVSGPPHEWAFETWTAVLSAHRGHRLSALAKVANLRRLNRDFPQTRTLDTEVAVYDEAMWAVNDRIGFRIRT